MRAGLLVLLTGCRGLLGIEEPLIFDAGGSPGLDDASTIDASTIDAVAITCAQDPIMEAHLGSNGTWLVVDPASGLATKLAGGTVAASAGGSYNQGGATYATILVTPTGAFTAPRLAPGGTELFVSNDTGGGFYRLLRSTYSPATQSWQTPQDVSLTLGGTAIVFGSQDAATPPTVTIPRRMIISRPGSFNEYVETTPTAWSQVTAVAPAFGVSFLGEASLSPDGLRMVFRGQVGPSGTSAYLVVRSTVNAPFGAAVRLSTLGSVLTPFLTADCKDLYYTNAANNEITHVSYP